MTDGVLIVGAGPTGLTLAVDLARRGVGVRIIDRADGPSQFSKALGVFPRTLEVFDDLGVAEECVRQGRRVSGADVCSGGATLVQIDLTHLSTPFPFILSLPQGDTERILLA